MRAKRRVDKGDELFIQYFDGNYSKHGMASLTSWQSFGLWGFVTPLARPVVVLQVSLESVRSAVLAVSDDSCADSDRSNKSKIGFVLDLRAAVSAAFPDDASTTRNFSLSAAIEQDEGPALLDWLHIIVTGAIGGGEEIGRGVDEMAFRLCGEIVKAALAMYPQTVEDDDVILNQLHVESAQNEHGLDAESARVSTLVQLRKTEKSVLHWWANTCISE